MTDPDPRPTWDVATQGPCDPATAAQYQVVHSGGVAETFGGVALAPLVAPAPAETAA